MRFLVQYCVDNWDCYLGDCTVLTEYIKSKQDQKSPKTIYLAEVLMFFNIYFRSIGQTVFVNNPFLGLLIMVAIFVGHTEAGIGCALGGLIANLADYLLGLHPLAMVENGVSSFNGSLIGTVLPALFHLVSGVSQAELWITVCIGSLVSVFLSSALYNSLGKLRVPFMTLSFNFVAIISFLNWQTDSSGVTDINDDYGHNSTKTIYFLKVLEGSVLSMGQVFAIHGLVPSLLIWLAVTLYSPLLAILSAVGALMGSFLPLLILDSYHHQNIYHGLWGYSTILSISCVSWAAFAFSGKSLFAGILNVISTILIQKALVATLSKVKVPVFTLPFTLSTLLIVMGWNEQGQKWKFTNMSEYIRTRRLNILGI